MIFGNLFYHKVGKKASQEYVRMGLGILTYEENTGNIGFFQDKLYKM